MKNIFVILFFFTASIGMTQIVQSPSKKLVLNFELDSNQNPTYTVNYKNKPVIRSSNLGFKLKDGTELTSNFKIDSIGNKAVNEIWQPVLGEQSTIKNNYNEMIVALSQKVSGR